MNYPIYLDYAATTPLDESVLEQMLPYFIQHFGNAGSRQHAYGWVAAEAIAKARTQVAELISAGEKEIVFTSGATESINLAIKGTVNTNSGYKRIITATTEHKATLEVCKSLENQGIDVTYLSVNANGEISIEELKNALHEGKSLVSLLHGNNETGVIHPIKQIADMVHENNGLLHVDATQSVGKIPVSVNAMAVDLLSFSSHKIYGPKGVGALFIKKPTDIISQQHGGGQERNLRGGTQNVSGIVGFGAACALAMVSIQEDNQRIVALRQLLESSLLEKLPQIKINGEKALRLPQDRLPQDRLPHIVNVSFPNVNGEELLMRLNKIAISNGSACTSAITEPSHVLTAMGLSNELAYASVRFSLGKFTTADDIHTAVNHVVTVYKTIV